MSEFDQAYFETIYFENYDRLYTAFLKRTGSDIIAQELTQLTFIKLWQYRHSYSGQSLLLCWYFLMSSPEPLLIEKLMMKITTKADRIPSAGYGLIAI
jgi:DNA-directed RNA polymerase specialized sigma subunit, sigma24 homolog